ncbi:MAG TPA: CoA ester lyase [Burkholderiaceae bacterium]|jgi:citrate lyase subunit beta/citryl-CoA lyase
MRSKLFVPGVRPELFAKALASAADAVSIDLEDAVPEDRKDEARAAVCAFLESAAAKASDKLIVVRVNALASAHFEADVQALAGAAVHLLNLPKIESAQEVRTAIAVMDRHAQGASGQVGLLLNIETPSGLHRAAEIAGASPRVWGLQLGLGDLFEPHGIERDSAANLHAAMFALRMAAAEAGVQACDGAFADIANPDGFRAEAQMSRALGFIGKSCIHPSQIALANEIYQPDEEQRAHAQRVVEAAAEAARAGRGAFVVDGRMIDPPYLLRARQIVAASTSRK